MSRSRFPRDPLTSLYTNWEVERTSPALVHLPRLFDFLGYVPYDPSWPLHRRLRVQREAQGLAQAEMARRLGVDETTVRRWEAGQRRPTARIKLGGSVCDGTET